jgi:hypothetical protein
MSEEDDDLADQATAGNWLEERLIHARWDLTHARRFAQFILDHDFGRKEDSDSELILLAFSISIVVCYSRPFKASNDRREKREPKLPDLLADLSPEELALHKRIIDTRDKEFAHSDATKLGMRFYEIEGGRFPISRESMDPLLRQEIQVLVNIMDKIYNRLKELGAEARGGA